MIERILDPGNYLFSLYMVPTLLTGVAVLVLGTLVLLRERITSVSLSFFLVTLFVALWLFNFSMMYGSAAEDVALFWAKAGYIGVPFIAPSAHMFVAAALKKHRISPWAVAFSWVLMAVVSLVAMASDLMITGVNRFAWGYYPGYSWYGLVFIALFVSILLVIMAHFWIEYRQTPAGRHKKRIRGLMIAFGVAYFGAFDFVAAFNIPLYPFGYLAIFGFILLSAYAIWKYHLVDITPAFAAKQIIETMSDALVVFDHEGIIRLVNRAACDLFGYPSDQLQGKHINVAIGGTDFSEQLNILRNAHSIDSYVMPYNHPDSGPRTLTLSASTMFDKGQDALAVICIVRDVTTRMRLDAALRESERNHRSLMEQAGDGIFITDAESNFLSVNSKACETLGYSEEELLRLKNRDVISPKSIESVPLRMDDLRNGKAILTERLLLRKDGTVVPAEINGTKLEDGRYQAIARDITERKQAEERLNRQLDRLAALRSVDIAITANLDLRVTLDIILDRVCALLRVDAADVLLISRHTNLLDYAAGHGFRSEAHINRHVRIGEGHAGQAALGRHTVTAHAITESGNLLNTPLMAEEGFIAYYAVPLLAKGQVKGVLEVFHRNPIDAQAEWLDFLEAMAGQAAIAIDNSSMYDDLQNTNTELALAYDTTLEGWSRALDLRDRETEGHSRRVTEMTVSLARAIGVSEANLVHIRRGALLHDIGKMGIPDSILLKPGPLLDEEWEIMRRHPTYAYDLLSPISFLRPALDIPYCHHERWDGTGYPRGLKGENIPVAARIFAVVDVWDALSSDRPYRTAWSEEAVRAHLRSLAGTQFDPLVVEVFLTTAWPPATLHTSQDAVPVSPGTSSL